MCGIVASVSGRGVVEGDKVQRAVACLRHRGPDAQTVWVVGATGAPALGHARLSIIDLETGDQPIASEDERLQLVANGEFYDFERIRRELEARGHVFRTRSDSEIALHLYEDRGAASCTRCAASSRSRSGTSATATLFAARDRFGIKPLYYATTTGRFYLASEVKALAALGVPLRWDPRDALRRPLRVASAGPHRCSPASTSCRPAQLPHGRRRARPRHPVLGLGLSAPVDADRRRRRSRASGSSGCARVRRSGPAAAARRRAGRLLPERRHRLVRGARRRVAAVAAAAPRLHAVVRPRRLRRGGARARSRRRGPAAEFCRIDVRSEHLADHFADAV